MSPLRRNERDELSSSASVAQICGSIGAQKSFHTPIL